MAMKYGPMASMVGDAVAAGIAVGETDAGGEPAHGGGGGAVGAVGGVGPLASEARRLDVHDVGLDLGHALPPKAPAFERGRGVVLDHHVGDGKEPPEEFLPLGVAHVEGYAPLAGMVVIEAGAEVDTPGHGAAGDAVLRRGGAEDVEAALPLEVDHLGAVRGEIARAPWHPRSPTQSRGPAHPGAAASSRLLAGPSAAPDAVDYSRQRSRPRCRTRPRR